MSMHLFPSGWGKDAAWGTQWITSHTATARALGKPAVLGAFATLTSQSTTYSTWAAAGASAGTNGMVVWSLCGRQDSSSSSNGWFAGSDGASEVVPLCQFPGAHAFGLRHYPCRLLCVLSECD